MMWGISGVCVREREGVNLCGVLGGQGGEDRAPTRRGRILAFVIVRRRRRLLGRRRLRHHPPLPIILSRSFFLALLLSLASSTIRAEGTTMTTTTTTTMKMTTVFGYVSYRIIICRRLSRIDRRRCLCRTLSS